MNTNGRLTYDIQQTYEWNFDHVPAIESCDVCPWPTPCRLAGVVLNSPLGVAAGPLLNGAWCEFLAARGFDLVTYKTVRSGRRVCYPLPNLQPVAIDGMLRDPDQTVSAIEEMGKSWAVSFGMPSKEPNWWREDVRATRQRLPDSIQLSVSVVGTEAAGASLDSLAEDYALCARWACESGADLIEANFSCPNVATRDGQLYQDANSAAEVAARIRASIDGRPLLIKIGHIADREDATRLIDALTPHANVLVTTNSLSARVSDAKGLAMFDGQPRGICGKAIRDASICQVQMLSQLIQAAGSSLELVGVGGIFTAKDVAAYLGAGASAVQLATAPMLDPDVALKIRSSYHAKSSSDKP